MSEPENTSGNPYKKLIIGVWNNSKIKPFNGLMQPRKSRLLNIYVFLSNAIAVFLAMVIMRTEFVPDEGWQSLEVAYRIHFKKGFLTWEWTYGLRSYLYPLFVRLPLYFIDSTTPSFSPTYVAAARLLQAGLLVIGEQFFYYALIKKYGVRTAVFATVIMTTTWFFLFAGPRTLTNSFELALNLISLYFLYGGLTIPFVGVVALNFAVRPTALIYWVGFIPEILKVVFKSWRSFISTLVVGLSVIYLQYLVDSNYYERPVFTWWNFFMFNFVEGKSAEFGVHPLCWYLYSAIPSILGLNVVLAYGVFFVWPSRYISELRVIAIFIGIYSFVSHKEIRFILPILPQFCIILGDIWGYLVETAFSKLLSTRWVVATAFACTISAQLAAALFFLGWHQAGIVPATYKIINESSQMEQPIIWVMMPCYSLPVHTYLHHPNATYEYFTCAPSGLEYEAPNLQVGDFRHLDLHEFITSKIGDLDLSPDFVLLYDYSTQTVLNALRTISNHLNYKICGTYFHTPFPFDSIGKEVQILCRLRPIAK